MDFYRGDYFPCFGCYCLFCFIVLWITTDLSFKLSPFHNRNSISFWCTDVGLNGSINNQPVNSMLDSRLTLMCLQNSYLLAKIVLVLSCCTTWLYATMLAVRSCPHCLSWDFGRSRAWKRWYCLLAGTNPDHFYFKWVPIKFEFYFMFFFFTGEILFYLRGKCGSVRLF